MKRIDFTLDKAPRYIDPVSSLFRLAVLGGGGGTPTTADGTGFVELIKSMEKPLVSLTQYGKIEQRNVPAGWVQVEYLRSNGTQYIDLGYKGNEYSKVRVRFRYNTATNVTGSGRVFGSRTGSQSSAFAIGTSSGVVSATGNKVFWCYDSQQFHVVDNPTFATDEWIDVVFSATEHTVNGVSYGSDYTPTQFITPSNLTLFGFDDSGTLGLGYVDIDTCQYWENGVLLRDLVSAYDGRDYQMYDKVTGNFLSNEGTGDFTGGDPVTPTPEHPMDLWTNNGVLKARQNLWNGTTGENCYLDSRGDAVPASNGYKASDYIPIKASTYYSFYTKYTESASGRGFRICFYTRAKVFIPPREGGDTVDEGEYLFNIKSPANAAYVRMSNKATGTAETICIEGNYTVGTIHSAVDSIYADGTPEVLTVMGKNQFDSTPYKVGYYIDARGDEQTGLPANEYIIRQASVKPRTQYTVSFKTTNGGYTQRFHAYTADGTWISQVATIDTSGGDPYKSATFTTPANCAYIRQGGRSQVDYQLELGDAATAYEAYQAQTVTNIPTVLSTEKDVDEVELIRGDITHWVGARVLTGEEDIGKSGIYQGSFFIRNVVSNWGTFNNAPLFCTHLVSETSDADYAFGKCIVLNNALNLWLWDDDRHQIADARNELASAYASGNPYIVLFTLAQKSPERGEPHSINSYKGVTTIVETAYVMNDLECVYLKE